MFRIKLILAPFSPFNIKCKKVNANNLWKCIFRTYGAVSFSYFPYVAFDHWRGGVDPQYLLEFLWIMLQYLIEAL